MNSETCAWSEGWADFLPLLVNNDPCFEWARGPCGAGGGAFENLEVRSRNDMPPAFPWGDRVEGRIAGALYDLFDNNNEGFDSAAFGFDPIAAIVLDPSPTLRRCARSPGRAPLTCGATPSTTTAQIQS